MGRCSGWALPGDEWRPRSQPESGSAPERRRARKQPKHGHRCGRARRGFHAWIRTVAPARRASCSARSACRLSCPLCRPGQPPRPQRRQPEPPAPPRTHPPPARSRRKAARRSPDRGRSCPRVTPVFGRSIEARPTGFGAWRVRTPWASARVGDGSTPHLFRGSLADASARRASVGCADHASRMERKARPDRPAATVRIPQATRTA